MKPRLLFIVTGDPRRDGRTAEAVRIAAGVSVGQKVEVAVYLREEAVLAVGESPEGMIDQEEYARYWAILAGAGRPVYVQENAPALREMGTAVAPIVEISDAQLARLTADHTCVLRF